MRKLLVFLAGFATLMTGSLAAQVCVVDPSTAELTQGDPATTSTHDRYIAGNRWYQDAADSTKLVINDYSADGEDGDTIIADTALTMFTMFHGVPAFALRAEQGDLNDVPQTLYLPVRPGCVFRVFRWRPSPGGAPPSGTEPEESIDVVRVFFATDRARSGTTSSNGYFGSNRSDSVHYGIARVNVPRRREPGTLGPAWYQFTYSAQPSAYVAIRGLRLQPRVAMIDSLRAAVARSSSKSVVVFVHGYNVSFDDGVRRTAQMVYDLGFDGAAALFSWPSKAALLRYNDDETEAEISIPNLERFLEAVAIQSGASRVHVVAHSMGSRVLVGALDGLARRHNRALLSQVVFAAPDINTRVFREQDVGKIVPAASRITLYASSFDRALAFSRRIAAGYERAGESGSKLVLVDGVQTVDASAAVTDWLGHSYVAGPSVLTDLHGVLRGRAPDERNLRSRQRSQRRYWLIPW